jgi:hypothetical protein
VTFFDHSLFGATLALSLGGHRRHGWGLVATSAIAGGLPDWDGLSLLFGPAAFADIHRVWGHNLLVATCAGGLTGALGYLCVRSVRVRRMARVTTPLQPFAISQMLIWILFGAGAALAHLPADLIQSSGADLPVWPVPLLWPFTSRGWAWPIVPWGDIGITLIFVAEMFALAKRPAYAQGLAVLTLVAVHLYIAARWLFGVVF